MLTKSYGVWGRPRSSTGIGGFIRYAGSTCINHLKHCINQPADIRDRAMLESKPPKKWRQYSPYTTSGSGTVPSPMFQSRLQSSQAFLPPSLPLGQANSPAIHMQTLAPSSPIHTTEPSPQLLVSSFPLVSTLPQLYGNPLHNPTTSSLHNQHPTASSLYFAFQPPQSLIWGEWSPDVQEKLETQTLQSAC